MCWNGRSSAFRSLRNRLGNGGPRLPTAEAACLEACSAGAVHHPDRGPEAFRLPGVGAHRSRRSTKAEAFLPVLHKRAMGVVGGVLLGNAIGSMFGGSAAQAAPPTALAADSKTPPEQPQPVAAEPIPEPQPASDEK
jgi:hypothetical protein